MVKSKKHSPKIIIMLIIITGILIASVIMLLAIPRNSSPCHGLLGSWRYSGTEYSGDYIYTFKNDGTGTYLTPDGEYDFTYMDNLDTFSAIYPGNTRANIYPYQIEEETLTILDSTGEPVTYICQ